MAGFFLCGFSGFSIKLDEVSVLHSVRTELEQCWKRSLLRVSKTNKNTRSRKFLMIIPYNSYSLDLSTLTDAAFIRKMFQSVFIK